MAAPVAPYCDTSDVYVSRIFMHDPGKTDFEEDGTPPRSLMAYYCAQISSAIDMQLSSMGYVVPLQAMSGQTWPVFQTGFLRYFCAVGAAAMLGGDASSPRAAGFTRTKEGQGSRYGDEWRRMMKGLDLTANRKPGGIVLRAASYAGSPVDYMLTQPSPPLSDAILGVHDPTRFDTLRDFTKRSQWYAQYVLQDNMPSRATANSPAWLNELFSTATVNYFDLIYARVIANAR